MVDNLIMRFTIDPIQKSNCGVDFKFKHFVHAGDMTRYPVKFLWVLCGVLLLQVLLTTYSSSYPSSSASPVLGSQSFTMNFNVQLNDPVTAKKTKHNEIVPRYQSSFITSGKEN